MGWYSFKTDPLPFRPLSELRQVPSRGWRGLRGGGRYVTDGTVLVDREKVEAESLLSEVTVDEADADVSPSEIEDLLSALEEAEHAPATIARRRRRSKIGVLQAAGPTAVAFAIEGGAKQGERARLLDAHAARLAEELVGGAELEAGPPGVLVWRKGGEFAAAVATLSSFEPIPKVPCPVTAECIRCDSKSQVLRGDVGDSPPGRPDTPAKVLRSRGWDARRHGPARCPDCA
ncbi:hypothetical protein [Salinibacter ruber]|uniref:hypothetical protein n=1 Tax=Salinibacter ruber TaxID=146919 RepID=UPI002169B6FA|nr:hypothetical protein [Salinibacter ruber]MCS4201455.1 hypothetical protein [Salinibacter ruber]